LFNSTDNLVKYSEYYKTLPYPLFIYPDFFILLLKANPRGKCS